MRKTAAYVLLAALLCFAAPAAAAGGLSNFVRVNEYVSGQFSDVAPGAWYEANVKLGCELGLINGRTASLFDPEGDITLAETIKLAAALHSIYYTGEAAFETGNGAWYSAYVDYALKNGVLESEYKDYTVPALRGDFAAILARALPAEALAAINDVPSGAVPDVDIAYSYGPSVYTLYRAGVLTGDSNGAFMPNTRIKRSESAAVITRMADPALRVAEAPSRRQLTAEEIAEKCGPAVFYIEIYAANGELRSTGSGFFITSSGVAVTNYHVISSARSAKIVTADGLEYGVLGVYDIDEENDLALLQIDGKDFDYLNVGDSETLRNGAQVYAIGSPLGLQNTISPGIISNASRDIDGTRYIQITAPLSPGSSGGALIDVYGDVIGVTTGSLYNGQGLNLAVPVDLSDALSRERYSDMRDFVKKTTEFYENSGIPDFGYHFTIERAYEESDGEAGSSEYWYDADELSVRSSLVISEYGFLLQTAGFRYLGAVGESSDDMTYVGVHYANFSTNAEVYCGVVASDDLEYIVVEIYE
ncbi:MAG: trypsin-like peptidase domain-containing protein [Oscillospiraceae bacterium]|jgi:S1-C subfamily serine protease|nr:trypsin-like peptidase domain-containing protein [Oscillospiraceae bacterium]